MDAQFDFGMIGIGVMGSNLLLNMADHGYAVIGFDLKAERAAKLEQAAKPGTKVKGVTDIAVMVKALSGGTSGGNAGAAFAPACPVILAAILVAILPALRAG